MYERIVVGTDGSDTAAVAVRHAVELAKLTGATLHIVHAFRPVQIGDVALSSSYGATMSIEGLNVGLEEHSAEVCAHAVDAAAREGVKVEQHTLAGDPSDALVKVAEQVDADLLVVGNRGMTGMKRYVLGSVPNKISHHAPCSVLIVDTTR